MRIRHIAICGLPRSTIFFHIISKTARLSGGRGGDTENKMCFDFLYNFLSEILLILRRIKLDMIKMYIGLHVKYPLFLSDFKAEAQTALFKDPVRTAQ